MAWSGGRKAGTLDTQDTQDGAGNGVSDAVPPFAPLDPRRAGATLPLDAIEEVEVTEELVVITPGMLASGPAAPDLTATSLTRAAPAAMPPPSAATSAVDTPGLPTESLAPAGPAVSVAAVAEREGELRVAGRAATARATDATSRAATAPASGVPVPPRGALLVLLGAFGLDALLYMLVVPFLPGRAQSLGASPLGTSVLFAMYAGCLFAATPVAGWLTDRLGARRVLLLGQVALAAATLAFAFAPGLPLLFVARGAQGLAAAATWTAGLVLVAQLYPAARRPTIFSRILIANGIGTLIGPPVGGLLYTLGGFSAPFLAVSFLVVLDGLGRLRFLPGRRALAAAQPAAADAESPARARLRQDPRFTTALLSTLAGAALLAMAEPSVPLYLSERFGVRPFTIGLVFGGVALVFIIFQPVVAVITRRVGANRAVAFGLVMSAGALVLEATAANAPQAEFALIHLALGLSLILLPSLEVLTRSGQEHHTSFGAIFAAYNLASAGGQVIGPIVAGAAITAIGPVQGFALLGLFPAVVGFALLVRRARPAAAAPRTPRPARGSQPTI